MDDIISFYNSLLSLNCPIWGYSLPEHVKDNILKMLHSSTREREFSSAKRAPANAVSICSGEEMLNFRRKRRRRRSWKQRTLRVVRWSYRRREIMEVEIANE